MKTFLSTNKQLIIVNFVHNKNNVYYAKTNVAGNKLNLVYSAVTEGQKKKKISGK